ncbi:hypothetical protein [Terrisporobacter petrolearius]
MYLFRVEKANLISTKVDFVKKNNLDIEKEHIEDKYSILNIEINN